MNIPDWLFLILVPTSFIGIWALFGGLFHLIDWIYPNRLMSKEYCRCILGFQMGKGETRMKLFWVALILTIFGGLGLVATALMPLERVQGTVIDGTGVHVNAIVYEKSAWYWPLSAIAGTALMIGSANLVLSFFQKRELERKHE